MSKDKRKKHDRAMIIIRNINYRGGRILNPRQMKRSGTLRFMRWMAKKGLIKFVRHYGSRRAHRTAIHTGGWET